MSLPTPPACRTIPKYPVECADTTANVPLATPTPPPAKFFTPACHRPASARNGFPFARNPATFARNPSTPARKRKTPKRKAESLGVRRSSTASARVKRSHVAEKLSRPPRKASRATLQTLSLRGREGWARRSGGWTDSTKPCVQWFGCCAQGLRGLSLKVLGLRVSLWTLVAESAAETLGAPGIVPGTFRRDTDNGSEPYTVEPRYPRGSLVTGFDPVSFEVT